MKTLIAIIIATVFGGMWFFLMTKQMTNTPKPEGKINIVEMDLRQATLKIDGMFCVSCATGAEYALKEKEGVIDASVDYDNENGKVIYNPKKISTDEIIQTVRPYTARITEDISYK